MKKLYTIIPIISLFIILGACEKDNELKELETNTSLQLELPITTPKNQNIDQSLLNNAYSLAKEKEYIKQIRSLNSENKCLRRKLRKMKKFADRNRINYDVEFDETIIAVKPQEKELNLCLKCNGEIKRIEFTPDHIFDICQRCRDRAKV